MVTIDTYVSAHLSQIRAGSTSITIMARAWGELPRTMQLKTQTESQVGGLTHRHWFSVQTQFYGFTKERVSRAGLVISQWGQLIER
jgi:hypothetical protein